VKSRSASRLEDRGVEEYLLQVTVPIATSLKRRLATVLKLGYPTYVHNRMLQSNPLMQQRCTKRITQQASQRVRRPLQDFSNLDFIKPVEVPVPQDPTHINSRL
jgi:hypothetical protein